MIRKKKILIVGASGFVGNYLYNNLKKQRDLLVYGTYCKSHKKDLIKFDYTFAGDFEKIYKISPEFIIWAAGEKDFKKTESDLSKTLTKNYYPFKTFLSSFHFSKNIKIVFISTDYVFEGSKGGYAVSDKTVPKSNYGIYKSKCEEFLTDSVNNFSIIRAGSIIGTGSIFFNWLVNSIKKESSLELFDNYFTPTPIVNVFNSIDDIINNKINEKIIHVSGGLKINRYDLGLFIKKTINSNITLIKKNFNESHLLFFKDLSLISSYTSDKNISTKNYILKLLK